MVNKCELFLVQLYVFRNSLLKKRKNGLRPFNEKLLGKFLQTLSKMVEGGAKVTEEPTIVERA